MAFKRTAPEPTMSKQRSRPSQSQDSSAARETAKRYGHGAKTDTVRERAILALLTEKTIKAAARRVGVDERTLRKWIQEDVEFQDKLKAARQALFDGGMHRIVALTTAAVDTLAALMGKSSPPSVRLGAARMILEVGMHHNEAETIRRRLGEIEEHQRRQDAERKA
jgi:transposase-like protein